MGLFWAVPFVGLLLTVAFGQASFTAGWERHYGKLILAWSAVTVAALTLAYGGSATAVAMAEMTLLDYLPFVVTILAFYVIAGGIHIRTRMSGHPAENTLLLALGTLAGTLMGTPGATLLFLPLVLTANRWRRHVAHTMVFLVFLVANLGGGVTPLGPPLLLGYLMGVDALWTVEHLLPPAALAIALLLALYFALDAWWFYPAEDQAARATHRREHDTLAIQGGFNLVLLYLAVATVAVTGAWSLAATVDLGPVHLPVPALVRLAVLVALAEISLRRTPAEIRRANRFGWAPMVEVAILFAGIFITMLPVLAILRTGLHGALAPLIRAVTTADGHPIDGAYFLVTGLLSAFLDNAPSFLVFFNVAGGDPVMLMGPSATTLTAISAGAAFFGGATYIGNAPNFMVRSIARERGIAMPGFFAFMLAAALLLMPVLGVVGWVFF